MNLVQLKGPGVEIYLNPAYIVHLKARGPGSTEIHLVGGQVEVVDLPASQLVQILTRRVQPQAR